MYLGMIEQFSEGMSERYAAVGDSATLNKAVRGLVASAVGKDGSFVTFSVDRNPTPSGNETQFPLVLETVARTIRQAFREEEKGIGIWP